MKKILSSVIAIAAVALTFSACQKQEVSASGAGEAQTVTFVAEQLATKTAFGTASGTSLPTLWTANDESVAIAQNYSSYKSAAVSPSADFRTATFSVDITDDGSGNYTFYSISPKSAVVSGVNKDFFSWNVEIPTEQTPSASSPDEKAMILAASSQTFDAFPTATVPLSFKHLTAYLDLTIENLSLESGDAVVSYVISADEDISYRHFYYVGGSDAGKFVANGAQSAVTVRTSETEHVWVAVAPVPDGTTFTVAVNTAASKLYKTTFVTGVALVSGNVGTKTVNFAGVSPEQNDVYHLVKNLDELTDGAKVIIATPYDTTDAYAMGANQNNQYAIAVAADKSADGSKIINPSSSVEVFTLSAGTVSGTTIAFKGTDGKYIGGSTTSNSNYMVVETTLSANSSWTVAFENLSTGSMNLISQGTATNRNNIRYNYNSGSPRFSCYSSTTSLTCRPAIYKLEGSGSSDKLLIPVPAISLNPTAVSLEKAASSATVTATFTNNPTTKTVTAYDDADMTTPSSWLSASLSGSTITVSATENTGVERKAYVKVYAANSYGNASATITVTQAGGLSYSFKKVSEITSGKHYLIAHTEAETTYYATVIKDPTKNYGYYYTEVAEVIDGTITVPNMDNALLFTQSGAGWFIQQDYDNRYMFCDGVHGSCQLSTTAPNNLWAISMAGGAATISFATGTATYYFHYTLYNTTKEFCPVKNTPGTVDLYELQ